ncbi:MAG: TlpA disulfide reductase family protein [Vicinamibacterales bacterium]
MRTSPAALVFGALSLAGLIFASACTEKAAAPPAHADAPVVHLLQETTEVPPFTMTDLDGRTFTSEELRGKVVLVNFWATWCPPCRAEIPDLVKLQDTYREKLVVIGVSEDEAPVEEVRKFAAAQNMNYPVVMVTPELSRIFTGVSALPTTFVIDPDGRIQQRHVGLLNPEETELETLVLAGLRSDVTIERVEDPKKAMLANAAQAKDIPGVDLSKLTAAQRTSALKALNEDTCTCGCTLTLAACRINDPECGISLPLARTLVDRIASGEVPADGQ